MSTNYYLRILPSKNKVKSLKTAIDCNNFKRIQDLASQMYEQVNTYEVEDIEKGQFGLVHLGQRAGGWRFLWNPNTYCKVRLDTDSGKFEWELIKLYNLSKEGIYKYLKSFGKRAYIVDDEHKYSPPMLFNIPKDEAERVKDKKYLDIYNELGYWSVEGFMQMALDWCKNKDYTNQYGEPCHYAARNHWNDLMEKEYPDYIFTHQDYWINGLRFANTTEFS